MIITWSLFNQLCMTMDFNQKCICKGNLESIFTLDTLISTYNTFNLVSYMLNQPSTFNRESMSNNLKCTCTLLNQIFTCSQECKWDSQTSTFMLAILGYKSNLVSKRFISMLVNLVCFKQGCK